MSIIQRLWPQETPTTDSEQPLAQRLKELVGRDVVNDSESDAGKPMPASQSAPQSEPVTEPPAPPGRERQEKSMENRSPEITPAQDRTEETSPDRSSSGPASKGPGQQFMERFHAAVGRTEPTAEKNPVAGPGPAPELQTIQKQFEADFRKRLDGALAEFERRVSSQALVDDVAGQIEQRLRLVADGIFQEAKSQAWTMHSAVVSELRSFREQFSKEIEERVGMLDQAAQHALELKEELSQALPKAEQTLRSLAVSGQEATAGFEAASKLFEDQLRRSHEEMSRNVDAQRQDLESLAQGLRQDGVQWKQEMETFRSEAGAAGELLGRRTDESLEKLSAAADQAGARAKDEIEKLAAEVESRVLSGGLVERATEQLGQATEELVEPALERVRQASDQAHAAAGALAGEGERVASQLDAARQQIEARLDSLLAEQLNLLDGTMSGFQRKASEELGSLVERVVAQSTSELDGRLHGLLQDLFANTSRQINTVARATLSHMNEGLKEAFQPDSVSADTAAAPAPDAANQ